MTRATRPATPGATEARPEPVTFIGVDPGLDGAVAALYPSGRLWTAVAPTKIGAKGRRAFDQDQMVAILRPFRPPGRAFVAVERVNAAPMRGRRQGTTSMFGFGRGAGLWLGILQALEIPFVEVDPRRWKKAILSGTAKDKAAAIDYVRRFHPAESLLATSRSRAPHTGIADAVCLAEYARAEWATMRAVLAASGSFNGRG